MPNAADQKLNILLVDDHPENILALESVLADLDQNLVRAESGREALRKLLDDDFAVILLDVQMPEMDGFETARLIRSRERSRHTPIIFLTAINKDDIHVAQGYSVGAVDYVFKPFQPDILRAKVTTFVELARKTRELELETVQRRQAEEEVRKLNASLERRVVSRTAQLEKANKELGRVLSLERQARAEAEANQQRLRFLSEASAILSGSLDYETTLRQVAGLAVPHIASHCCVDIADDDRRLHRVVTASASGSGFHRINGEGGEERFAASARAMASGRTELVANLGVLHGTSVSNPGPRRPAKEPRAMVVPLIARGDVIGAITLARHEAQPAYTGEDVVLAEDLARRAAAAIDNAHLYHELEEAGQRKDEFLAMLAHELRNPLAAVSSATYALQRLENPTRRFSRLCAIASRQTQHLSRLVDDLLDISRITRGKIELRRETVELGIIIQRAVEATMPFMQERGHRFNLRLSEEPIWLDADPTRLEQILSNLLNNAAKYTEPGGEIALTVDVGPAMDEESGRVTISVKDNGVGIPKPLLPAIFELFTQAESSLARSEGGLGIGLALVRKLVHLHHGEVAVHSEGEGTGSEFSVTFPTTPAPPASLHPAPVSAPVLHRSGTAARLRGACMDVLVVDDNEDAAETLLEILDVWGHEARVAHTGPTAIERAQERVPEVMLLDIGLPGIDGYEVAREVRKLPGGGNVYLIALTGYGQAEDRRRSREAGFDLHLTKPVDPEELRRAFDAFAGPPEASATVPESDQALAEVG